MNLLNKKLVLASKSPRRREILRKAGFEFEIFPSNYDEKISGLLYKKELVENCAYNKALDVLKSFPEALIISSDTVVVAPFIDENNDKKEYILGKPKDFDEAFLMLQNLSSKTHCVACSICLVDKNKAIKNTGITKVTFRALSDLEIKNYINSKKPFDKAGSYGIQDEGFDFALKIEGEYDNVVGFPLKLFKKMLKEF